MLRHWYLRIFVALLVIVPMFLGLKYNFSISELILLSIAIIVGVFIVLDLILTIIGIYIFIKTIKNE